MISFFGYKPSIPNKTVLLLGACAFLSKAAAQNSTSSTGEALGDENAWLPIASYTAAGIAFTLSFVFCGLSCRKASDPQRQPLLQLSEVSVRNLVDEHYKHPERNVLDMEPFSLR